MPEEIMNDISNMMNAMALTVFQTVFMYIGLPVLLMLIIGGFIFKLKWKALQLIIISTAFIGLYFFVTNGLPNMQEAYFLKINS
ncbi:hypothetical protein [Sutcliffiella halmapala]|uniref:hypothetical protein n=1 Tax=Sutcliffiella halmapala TaxID=79882 RepID=UPI000995693D|nr:hypothetical protein [Sutcliffiella halmapala]